MASCLARRRKKGCSAHPSPVQGVFTVSGRAFKCRHAPLWYAWGHVMDRRIMMTGDGLQLIRLRQVWVGGASFRAGSLRSFRMWKLYSRLFVAVVVVATFSSVSACAPPPSPPAPCGGEREQCVEPGHTAAAICDAGTCAGTTDACTTDTDCYRLVQPGDAIPAWNRPQGGLGTRLNLRIEGVEAPYVRWMQTLITDRYQLIDETDASSRVSCSPASCEEGLGCECDEAAGFSCVSFPSGANLCAELICDQVNRTFPLDEHPHGALVTPELPVRFQNALGLEELDGREVSLTMGVLVGPTEASAEFIYSTVPVVLQVGEFVTPSWWDQ